MMAKSDKFAGGYYRHNACGTVGAREIEESGSSGRIDMDFTGSEDSSTPTRRCINLNVNKQDKFCVPTQILSLSHMSASEKREVLSRLKWELEQTQKTRKRVDLQRVSGVGASTSSDILSCSNVTNGPRVQSLQNSTVGMEKKGNPMAEQRMWNRSSSGKFQSAKQIPRQASTPSTANVMLMKQCETLLKRLMSHQYGWVFNKPVDVVKLNIPDYLTIIKHPMDLGTVKRKLSSGAYAIPLDFAADVRLTFRNAMEYNPRGHDVHIMADTLSKFFETRWKPIEKKLLSTEVQVLPQVSGPQEDMEIAKMSPPKKRKVTSFQTEIVPEPVKRVITDEEKHSLSRELESLLGEMPGHIIDFLREHCSNGKDGGEDEIEIDIDDLSADTLFNLRKLLDDFLREKQKNQSKGEPCEIEMLNDSGLSNSSMHQHKGNEMVEEDVDIGGNEPPVSSCPPVEIEKDICLQSSKCICPASSNDSESGSSSKSESDVARESTSVNTSKVPETLDSGAQLGDETSAGDHLERNPSVSGLDQLEQTSQQKPSSVESDSQQDGESVRRERQVSPEKAYRYAMLKKRYADTILKAKEKTLIRDDSKDPEKRRQEKEELELLKKKERARLQAEARAAEEARKKAEAVAAAEARKKRELEREAARQALLQMEKTVEINENSQLLEDLEMLGAAPAEHLLSSVDETSPGPSQDGLGSFKFGAYNPLAQLGLFMKDDEEEEEGEPLNLGDTVDDVEEGEID